MSTPATTSNHTLILAYQGMQTLMSSMENSKEVTVSTVRDWRQQWAAINGKFLAVENELMEIEPPKRG